MPHSTTRAVVCTIAFVAAAAARADWVTQDVTHPTRMHLGATFDAHTSLAYFQPGAGSADVIYTPAGVELSGRLGGEAGNVRMTLDFVTTQTLVANYTLSGRDAEFELHGPGIDISHRGTVDVWINGCLASSGCPGPPLVLAPGEYHLMAYHFLRGPGEWGRFDMAIVVPEPASAGLALLVILLGAGAGVAIASHRRRKHLPLA